MRLTALTSALAQKLSLPTLLISDMALVFWYTEPCKRQRVLCGAALGSPGLKQQPWGLHRAWCPLQRPASTRWPEGPESCQTTPTGVSGCTRPLWMEASPPASDSRPLWQWPGSLHGPQLCPGNWAPHSWGTWCLPPMGRGLPAYLTSLHRAHHPGLCRTCWCCGLVTGLSLGYEKLQTSQWNQQAAQRAAPRAH